MGQYYTNGGSRILTRIYAKIKPAPMAIPSAAIDWFPLWLSLEVATSATVISLLLGIWPAPLLTLLAALTQLLR